MRRDFYDRPVLDVARDLIGCVVRHGPCAGMIVETEAYHETEPACHAFSGWTPRTATLFGAPGLAYVYRSYGIHFLLNAVAEHEGVGAAALIRGLEPVDGIDLMRERRDRERLSDLCSGPGKLTQALGIGLERNGGDLDSGPVRIEASRAFSRAETISASRRIGITKAVELPWRFCLRGHPCVSQPRPRN